MKKIIAIFAVLASVSANAAPANTTSASTDKMWSIGGLIGYGTASVGGTSISGLTWGAEVNTMISPTWNAGLYWSNTKKDSVTLMPIMLQANYFVDGWKGFYVGPRVGITSFKNDFTFLGVSTSTSTSDFTLGAQAGYDMPLTADWSVGVNANWNYIMNSADKISLFNFVVPVKFHF